MKFILQTYEHRFSNQDFSIAFRAAAKFGYVEILEFLLQRHPGRLTDTDFSIAFRVTAQRGCVKILELLLQRHRDRLTDKDFDVAFKHVVWWSEDDERERILGLLMQPEWMNRLNMEKAIRILRNTNNNQILEIARARDIARSHGAPRIAELLNRVLLAR